MNTTTQEQLLLPLDFFVPAAMQAETAVFIPPLPIPDDAPAQPETRQTVYDFMGSFGYSLRSIFDCMEIAEEEIKIAKMKHPSQKDLIHDTFRYLQPSELLTPRTKHLYRHHAREIIQRVINGEKLEPPTAAELLCIFCAASLKSPLITDAAAAYFLLFSEAYPHQAPRIFQDPPRESYAGRAQELIDELKRKSSFQVKRDCRS